MVGEAGEVAGEGEREGGREISSGEGREEGVDTVDGDETESLVWFSCVAVDTEVGSSGVVSNPTILFLFFKRVERALLWMERREASSDGESWGRGTEVLMIWGEMVKFEWYS